jgi:hypothetical protein
VGGGGYSWVKAPNNRDKEVFIIRITPQTSPPLYSVATGVVPFPVDAVNSIYGEEQAFDIDASSSRLQIAGGARNALFANAPMFYNGGAGLASPINGQKVGYAATVDKGMVGFNRIGALANGTFAYLASGREILGDESIAAMAKRNTGEWTFVGSSKNLAQFDELELPILREDLFKATKAPGTLDGLIFRTNSALSVLTRAVEDISGEVTEEEENHHTAQSISVNLYPNPAADHLTISMDGGVREDLGYAVVDMAGKVLLSGTLGSPQLMLPIGHLPTGAYLLVLTRATGATVSMSWIKQ